MKAERWKINYEPLTVMEYWLSTINIRTINRFIKTSKGKGSDIEAEVAQDNQQNLIEDENGIQPRILGRGLDEPCPTIEPDIPSYEIIIWTNTWKKRKKTKKKKKILSEHDCSPCYRTRDGTGIAIGNQSPSLKGALPGMLKIRNQQEISDRKLRKNAGAFHQSFCRGFWMRGSQCFLRWTFFLLLAIREEKKLSEILLLAGFSESGRSARVMLVDGNEAEDLS